MEEWDHLTTMFKGIFVPVTTMHLYQHILSLKWWSHSTNQILDCGSTWRILQGKSCWREMSPNKPLKETLIIVVTFET